MEGLCSPLWREALAAYISPQHLFGRKLWSGTLEPHLIVPESFIFHFASPGSPG